MTNKAPLHITIDSDLLDLAKKLKGESINSLSEEFEEWLKIRVNQSNNNETFDYDKEYARLRLEMSKLESKKDAQANQEQKQKEKVMVLDHIIDNQLQYDKPEEIPIKRFVGLQFLFKQKFNEKLADTQAKELLANRLKERGLVA